MEISKPISLLFLLFLFITLFFTMASSIDTFVTTASETDENGEAPVMEDSDEPTSVESAESSHLRRFLARYNPRAAMTCNKHPKVCHARGSPGRDCCKKRCVDLKKDNLNCGQCGRKCKYGEVCCRRKCVNILYDRKNCGGCHRRCKKGTYCRYGMCSYA